MDVEYNILKRNKNNSGKIKYPRKSKTQEISDKRKVRNLFPNFYCEEELLSIKYQSKEVKIFSPNKNILEETSNKLRRKNMKNLKSLSSKNLGQNLFKTIEPHKILDEELNDSKKNKNKLCEDNKENYKEKNEKDKSNDEIEKEKKNSELIITNNIKNVFIDSKINKKYTENKNEIVSNSTSFISCFDYELNFYKTGSEIRQSYFSKLITKKIWMPNMKSKKHKSINFN